MYIVIASSIHSEDELNMNIFEGEAEKAGFSLPLHALRGIAALVVVGLRERMAQAGLVALGEDVLRRADALSQALGGQKRTASGS